MLSNINISSDEAYAGVINAINQPAPPVDILDDLECMQDNIGLNLDDEIQESNADSSSTLDMSDLMKSIKEVSKGVSEKTGKEYVRLMKLCENFVHDQNLIPKGTNFFTAHPHSQSAEYLAAWIMHFCDELNLDGSLKDPSIVRATYTHAQKMRAAATFGFGRIHGLGMVAWHHSEMSGKMLGNPSVSETLSSYMLSLRCRKTLKGETATSARAVSSDLTSQLYHFNSQSQFQEPRIYEPTPRNAIQSQSDWAGARARALLNLAYALAFCDLLRVDELLKIQVHDIVLAVDKDSGYTTLTLTLPFRKTSQFGDIKPFVHHKMPLEYTHLCVVNAYSRWLDVSGIDHGYLF